MNDQRLAAEFERRTGRRDAQQATAGLRSALQSLSDLLYRRLHEDVENALGWDSMLVPVSEIRSRQITAEEIGLYQVAESTMAARQSGYVPADEDWYVPWLAEVRLGEPPSPVQQKTIDTYLWKTPHARQLALTNVLAAVLPESRRAPLVLFRVFPLAVQIVTAMAFGDQAGAEKLRAAQAELLPIIASCHSCRGRVLENGQVCGGCLSPLWKTEWLTAAD